MKNRENTRKFKLCNLINSPLVLSLTSALLLSLPWLSLSGFWSLIAWVPIFILHEKLKQGGRKGFLWWVSLTIVMWHAISCFWVANATLLSIPVILIGCWGMLFPAWVAFYFADKRNKKALSYTILVSGWVVCEWWLALGDVSFPWLQMGSAFFNEPCAVQWYSILGSYGGSLWVMVANILIFTALTNRGAIIWAVSWVVVPFVMSLIVYYNYEDSQQKVKVAIIQPNVDAYKKFNSVSAREQIQNIINIASKAEPNTKFYIAPETAVISYVNESNFFSSQDVVLIQNFLKSRSPQAKFIIGASSYDDMGHYNTALYIDTANVVAYHKGKLVLGVEVVPQWAMAFAEAIDLGGYVGSLGKGEQRMVVESGGVGVGAAICYESIYGEYMSEFVQNGAEFLAVITNDGWWGNTPGYHQHFAFSRLRAVENRRWVARSANTGISGVINARGEVLESLGWDTNGVINSEVGLNSEQTFYTLWGDIVVRLSMYVFSLSLLYAFAMHFKRKNKLVE